MLEMKRPLQVFLCHASQDKPVVRELAQRLFAEGWIDPWLDEKKLLPGQDWRLKIEEAVETSDVVIICLSCNSVTKEGYVQKELRYAREIALEKPEGTIFLVPLRLDDCEVPRELRFYQWVDYFGEKKEGAYRALLESLKVRNKQRLRIEERETTQQRGIEAPKPEVQRREIPRKSNKATSIILLGFAGIIVAALLSSPLIEKWFFPTLTPTVVFTATTLPLDTPIALTDTLSTPAGTEGSKVSTPVLTSSSVYSSVDVSLVKSFPAPGLGAEGIAWDGAYLWLSDNSGVIFKVDTSGKVLDSFRSPDVTPMGLAWDGSNFWVFTTNHLYIYQFQIVDKKAQTVHSFPSPAEVFGGGITQDMAWDGKNLWYANQFKVYNLDNTGKVLNSITFPQNVTGLDWDGSNLWIAYNGFPDNATLSRANTTGEILGTYPSLIFEINGLAWADGYLWVLGVDSLSGDPMIYELSLSVK